MIGRKIVESGSTAVTAVACDMFDQMLPFLVCMFVVVLVDLRFGRAASRYRGEVVRWSGSIRRTMDKFISYLCWISLAVVLDMAFCEFGLPIRYFLLALVFCIELQSIFNNYLEPKGKRIKIDLKTILGGKLKGVTIVEKEDDV